MAEWMKALQKTRPGPGAELVTVDIPTCGPGDVLVRNRATSICGTDYHIYAWDPWAAGRIKPPLIFGHEFAGEVVAVGSAVTRVRTGDVVTAECHVVCGRCTACRTGQAHVCQQVEIIGVDRQGGFADYVCVPETNVWKCSPRLPADLLSVQDPLGNAVHTVLAGEVAGLDVAVLGCGAIGLFAVAVARAVGAGRIIATDLNAYRLNLAERAGATLTVNPAETDPVEAVMEATGGAGVAVALEMSGSPHALRQGLRMLRNAGRMSILGLPVRPVELDIGNDIVFKGLTIQGITGRRMYETWYQMSALLESGRLDIGPLVTHKFRLEDYERAMDLVGSGNSGKVILLP